MRMKPRGTAWSRKRRRNSSAASVMIFTRLLHGREPPAVVVPNDGAGMRYGADASASSGN